MKRIAIIVTALGFPFLLMGQTKKFEYTPKVKNKIEITNLVGEISLQNSTGSALVIESDFSMERPDRAAGLKLLGAMEDNTDLGVNVSEENGIVSIQGATRQVRDYKYKILVPTGMAVNLDYGSPFAKEDVVVDSFTGSLEIKTLNANVKITNSSGPFTVSSGSGNVEVVFDKINQNEPTSLASVSGLIDVTLPGTDKANIEISTINGNVYNNLDLKSAVKPVEKTELTSGKVALKEKLAYGMNAIRTQGGNSYTLNGGGQKVYLKSILGNIYLRKR
jgi:lia operon protein LiaG